MILWLREKPGSRRGVETGYEREYECTYLVLCNSPYDTEITIRRDPRLPRHNAAYRNGNDSDAAAVLQYCELYRVMAGDSDRVILSNGGYGHLWEARCKWSTKVMEISAGGAKLRTTPPTLPKNPLQIPNEVRWNGKLIEWNNGFDYAGKPLNNSAGDKLADAPPIVTSHGILTVTRIETSYNHSLAYRFSNSINASPWKGIARWYAKCDWPDGIQVWDENTGIQYWKVTYTFEISTSRAFHPTRLADRGLRTRSAAGIKQFALDDMEYPVTEPVYLDGSGGRLSENQIQRGNIQLLDFAYYKSMDFNALRL